VKTTVEIAEPLLARAKIHATRTGRSLKALIEEGLRLVLEEERARASYQLPDQSFGKTGDPNPLETLSWQDLRSEIYGDR
jgi:hypothetical protein